MTRHVFVYVVKVNLGAWCVVMLKSVRLGGGTSSVRVLNLSPWKKFGIVLVAARLCDILSVNTRLKSIIIYMYYKLRTENEQLLRYYIK